MGDDVEAFDARVARKYFSGPHFPQDELPAPSSLETAATIAWGGEQADAVDWRERLQSQLRDGSFHYIAVAQRFTRPVLRTVEYLNATMKACSWLPKGHVPTGTDVDSFDVAATTSSCPGNRRPVQRHRLSPVGWCR